jgi:hypothetical protein
MASGGLGGMAVQEEDVRVIVVPGHEWLEVELAQPHDTGQGRGRAGGRGVAWTRRRSGRCGEGGDNGERARLGSRLRVGMRVPVPGSVQWKRNACKSSQFQSFPS